MARQNINIGTSANSGTGDPLRTAFTKSNENFVELYAAVGTIPTNTNQLTNGSGFITVSDLPRIPADVSDLTDTQGLLGGGGSSDRLVNGEYQVVLNSDGDLTLPVDGDLLIGEGGRWIKDCGNSSGVTSMRWINVPVDNNSTQLLRIYSGDPNGEGSSDERAQIRLDWLDENRSGLTIRAFDRTNSEDSVRHDWQFRGDGNLVLPAGGTIAEGVVTDNPTIELTPANPEVESQKLIIKGGGTGFFNSENGITITTYSLRVTSGNTAYFDVYTDQYPGETFYWWVDTYSPGQEFSPDNGQITFDEFGYANIVFTVIDDTVPLRIYVADTLYNAYANNKGAVSVTINEAVVPDLYHLHLTTGDLQETSVILGTDEHNVRTKINGSVELTSYDYDSEQTYRLNFKNNVLKISSTDNVNDEDLYIKAEDDLYLDALDDDIHIRASDDIRLRPGYDFADDNVGYELRFTDGGTLIFYNGNEGNDYGYIRMYSDGEGGLRNLAFGGDQNLVITTDNENHSWIFDRDGDLTLPRGTGKINASVSDGIGLQVEATLDFEIKVNDGQGGSNIWSFAGSDITFPDATIQTTAWSGGRVVGVPSTSVGTEGDKAGDIAFSSGYLYYCIQNFSGPASIGMTVLASSGTIVWVNSSQYAGDLVADFTANPTGWTYNGIVITNIEANNQFGPGYVLSAATSWNVLNGVVYNIQAPGVDNIWKRVAWSNDTW
jgi:hypothetical protein